MESTPYVGRPYSSTSHASYDVVDGICPENIPDGAVGTGLSLFLAQMVEIALIDAVRNA